MLAGDPYLGGDPESSRLAYRGFCLADEYYRRCVSAGFDAARPILTKLLGGLGERSTIIPPVHVDHGEHLFIGSRTFVNDNLTALDIARITVGNDCQAGPNVRLLTPAHPLEVQPRRDKLESAEPITLGDNSVVDAGGPACHAHGDQRFLTIRDTVLNDS
ncbi:MAG: maltose acetyltransferase [Micrococcales bacterium]|nr:MAG: maltose acetyltransferase [Micrococcales bacterium]